MKSQKYKCPKCGGREYELDEVRVTTNLFTKLFNIQNKRFTTLTCTRCKYTEFFAEKSSKMGDIIDFFTN